MTGSEEPECFSHKFYAPLSVCEVNAEGGQEGMKGRKESQKQTQRQRGECVTVGGGGGGGVIGALGE